MGEKLFLSVSPHLTGRRTVRNIMLDVIIALIPAVIASVIIFGLRSLAVYAATVISAVLFEYLFDLAVKRDNSIGDLSAVITGLLLAMNLPASVPLWQAVVGSFFAIVIVKCLFGGLGKNFANPAIVGRIVMLLAFAGSMSDVPAYIGSVDAVSTATPLAAIAAGDLTSYSPIRLLLGAHSGALGETCAAALLAGGIYLLARRVISWHTPVCMIATVYAGSLIVTGSPYAALLCILSGGLFLGAIFMATDYVTTPTTKWGQVIFGVGCGLLTILIRFWGSYPEGVSFSILLMNILTPFIDKWTRKKPFGGVDA